MIQPIVITLIAALSVTFVFTADFTQFEPQTITKKGIQKSYNYQFNKPTSTFRLGMDLEEISGLGMGGSSSEILAIQDEKGKLFKINTNDGELLKNKTFGKKRDYEGIELVGDDIYVLESNGNIHRTNASCSFSEKIKLFKTMEGSLDAEGLGYDAKNHELLIALKAPIKGKKHRFERSIYSVPLGKTYHAVTPAYMITLDDVQKFIFDNNDKNLEGRIEKNFMHKQKSFKFYPSGLAVHPITQDHYIISSVGKTLIILDSLTNIKQMVALDPTIHQQPEGICFDDKGVLYISNEGKNQLGRIHKFLPEVDTCY